MHFYPFFSNHLVSIKTHVLSSFQKLYILLGLIFINFMNLQTLTFDFF